MVCCDEKILAENIVEFLEKVTNQDEVVQVSTKNGKVIMVSEEQYNGMMETIYLNSIPRMAESIEASMKLPIEELISEEEVEW